MADPYIGEIRLFGGTFAPVGWSFCNGSLLNISENDALFNLIGTTYGGDGQTTFALPNLQGRLPLHQGGGYALGQTGGTETVTLLGQQLGLHTHPVAAGSGANSGSPGNTILGTPAVKRYLPPGSGTALNMSPQIIQPAGGNQPHDNMQPYLVVSFIIALEGIYPSQN